MRHTQFMEINENSGNARGVKGTGSIEGYATEASARRALARYAPCLTGRVYQEQGGRWQYEWRLDDRPSEPLDEMRRRLPTTKEIA